MRAYFTSKFKAKEDYVFFYGAIIAYKGELVGSGGEDRPIKDILHRMSVCNIHAWHIYIIHSHIAILLACYTFDVHTCTNMSLLDIEGTQKIIQYSSSSTFICCDSNCYITKYNKLAR